MPDLKPFDEQEIIQLALSRGLLSDKDIELLESEFSDARTLASRNDSSGSLCYLLLKLNLMDVDTLSRLISEVQAGHGKDPGEAARDLDALRSYLTKECSIQEEGDRGGAGPGKDRYQIVSLLGEGGMGKVYKAHDRELNRYVALKFLRGEDPEMTRRFIQEARVQARVNHENVCNVYDTGVLEGKPFIAMQYIEGSPLESFIDKLNIREKVTLIIDVARAVHAAHEVGLIHRDINPRNILIEAGLDGNFRSYVVDFGLAREAATPSLTVTGAILGTAYYMSPEQALGEIHHLDHRTDVYSLGATLYHLLCGSPPFSGTVIEVLRQIETTEPDRPSQVFPGLPRDLETIVLKCLEKEPSRRYPSALDLAEDLQRFLRFEPIKARPATFMYRFRRKVQRNKALAGMALILMACIAVFSGYLVYNAWNNARQESFRNEFEQEIRYAREALRHAYTSELHDTTEEVDAVRERMELLRERVDRAGRLARGPGNYALGRVSLLLNESRQAREHLSMAWESDYRKKEVAYALGVAFGNLYREKMSEAKTIPDEVHRNAAIERIQDQYRTPALEYLKISEGVQIDSPEYAKALIAYFEERYGDALRETEEACRKVPWLYEAWKLKGDIYLGLGKDRDFSGEYDRAWDYYMKSGEAYAEASRIGRSDTDVYARDCHRHIDMIEMKGITDRVTPDLFEGALEACGNALKADPGNALAYIYFSDIYRFQVDYSFQNQQDPYAGLNRAIEMAAHAIQLDPENESAYDRMGLVQWRIGVYQGREGKDPEISFQKAVESYEESLRRVPGSVVSRNNLGVCYRALGISSMQKGKDPREYFNRAIDCFEMCIQSDPEHLSSHVFNNLGRAYEGVGLYGMNFGEDTSGSFLKAVDCYHRALQINPNDTVCTNNLANAFWALGDLYMKTGRDPLEYLNEAIEWYQRSLEIKPNHMYAFSNLANTYLKKAVFLIRSGGRVGDLFEKALENSRASVEINPRYANGLRNRSRIYRVLAEWTWEQGGDPSKDLSQAERLLEEASAINQDGYLLEHAELMLLKARVAGSGRKASDYYRKGAEWIRRAIDQDPDQSELYAAGGRLYRHYYQWALGHDDSDAADFMEKSLLYLAKALEVNPSLAEAKAERGVIHYLSSRGAADSEAREKLITNAVRDLSESIERNPYLGGTYAEFLEKARMEKTSA